MRQMKKRGYAGNKTTTKKQKHKTSKRTKEILEFKGFLSFLILHELKNKNLYGDQLAVIIGIRRGSKVTPGTIYPALKRLREDKLITYLQEDQKKIYRLTAKGKKELENLYKKFSTYFKGLKSKIRK